MKKLVIAMLSVVMLAACNDNKSGQQEGDYDVVSPGQAVPDSPDLRRDSVPNADTGQHQNH